jgi:hypothetical protein
MRLERPFHGHQGATPRIGFLRSLFVTTHATSYFSRLKSQKALHSFDRFFILVQSDQEECPHGGRLKEGGTVGFDGDRAQNAFEVTRFGEVADGFSGIAHVLGFRKDLDDHEFLDLARLHALHIPAFVDVLQHEQTGVLTHIDLAWHARFSLSGCDGPRFLTHEALLVLFCGKTPDTLRPTLVIHDENLVSLGDQEALIADGIGIAFKLRPADAFYGRRVVRPVSRDPRW